MDAGVGEAAVAEGAKGAAEAGAVEAGAGTLTGAGAGDAYAAMDAAYAGAGANAGADLATTASLTGAGANEAYAAMDAGYAGAGSNVGGGLMDTLSTGVQYANEANNAYKFAKDPSLQTGLNLGLSTANLAGGADVSSTGNAASSAVSSPVGTGGADIPGVSDPLATPSGAAPQYSGSPTLTPDAPPPGMGEPGTSYTATPGADGATVAPSGTAAPDAPLQASPVNQGMLDKVFSQQGLQTANLGLGAASLAKQLTGAGSAQKQFNAAAAPTSAVSNQLLQQFQSGQINGADAYNITQYTQQSKAKIDQYYAKAGLSNSSMHQQALQQVDQQAEAMREQAVQNLLKNGLSAAGVSNPLISQGITAGVNQDAASMKAMQDFIAQLAKMNTPQASTPAPAPTGTPG